MEKLDRVRFLVIALNAYTKLYDKSKGLVIYKPTDTTGKMVATTLVEDSDCVRPAHIKHHRLTKKKFFCII